MSIIADAVRKQKRFEVAKTPGYIAIRDTKTDQTLLTIVTKVDPVNSRDTNFLSAEDLNDRAAFVLNALEQTYGK